MIHYGVAMQTEANAAIQHLLSPIHFLKMLPKEAVQLFWFSDLRST